MDKHLQQIKLLYDYQVDRNKDLINRLKEYNKDEQIAKRDKQIEHIRKNSLVVMSDKEKADYIAFRDEHFQKCNNPNKYIFEIVGTGLGACIKITCPKCNESKDITDTDSW